MQRCLVGACDGTGSQVLAAASGVNTTRLRMHCAGSLPTLHLFSQHACISCAALSDTPFACGCLSNRAGTACLMACLSSNTWRWARPPSRPLSPSARRAVQHVPQIIERHAAATCRLTVLGAWLSGAPPPVFNRLLLLPRLRTIFRLARACRA